MKMKRIISSLLAVLMLLGAFSVTIAADDAEDSTVPAGQATSNTQPTIDYFTGKKVESVTEKDSKIATWQPVGPQIIFSETDKLNTMTKMIDKDGYVLYVDKFSGEVAVYCKATGEALFSNPYNIAESTANDSLKGELMSQLVVNFSDIETGQSQTFYSFIDAVKDDDDIKGQLVVRNIKGGVRIEYTIGRPESRLLVPVWIEKERFETEILQVMKAAVDESGDPQLAFEYQQFFDSYNLQDPSAETSEKVKENMYKQYPITKKAAIYALDSSTSAHEKTKFEQLIKTYCPDYTYEDLDEDHLFTNPPIDDKNPPLFKMALEYSLDESGLTVRLPANGIRFNEALYQLNSIEVLPYMGAGAYSKNEGSTFINNGEGYTFFPDGAGSLFRFDKVANIEQRTAVTGKVYGQDYAYHDIKGQLQEAIRYPVFGVVRTQDENIIEYDREYAAKAEIGDEASATYPTEKKMTESGFVAIVEEGDALMELTTFHYQPANYNTVKMTVYPRPKDSYSIADSISVGEAGSEWTVVSSRKYTGNCKIRYIMLTEGGEYDTSYTGMAKAYRDYLEKNGTLTRLTADDVKSDIPLYVQTFGAVETTERFLSVPVDVMTPLTTFDDIKVMYDELAESGVSNINFILTGYVKGGMTYTQVPYNLKWENNVSDELEFEDLVAYAKEKGFGVYPDFDFAYTKSNSMFDGLTMSKHAVKTIDDRYTTRREYSATKQMYLSYFDVAVSPAYYSHFYEKLTDNYLEYGPMGIAVSTLGNSLNSDFDEDEPYNREDSKNFTVQAMQYLDEHYDKVLVSGGNNYTWKYVDYITDVALDSSRFSQAYASVPFLGMVLHGYIEIAGEPLNMEGNIDYAILKAIENGASLNFILSYQNTNVLKNFEDLSKYYSVRYDIWRDDVISIYSEVNGILGGLQTSRIVAHEFVDGLRTPDNDELIFDAEATINAAIDAKKAYEKAMEEFEVDSIRNARYRLESMVTRFESFKTQLAAYTPGTEVANATVDFKKYVDLYNQLDVIENGGVGSNSLIDEMKDVIAKALNKTNNDLKTAYDAMTTAKSDLDTKQQDYDEADDAQKPALEAALNEARLALTSAQTTFNAKFNTALAAVAADSVEYTNIQTDLAKLYTSDGKYLRYYQRNAKALADLLAEFINEVALAEKYYALIDASDAPPAHKDDYKDILDTVKADLQVILASVGTGITTVADLAELYNGVIAGIIAPTKYETLTDLFTLCTTEQREALLPTVAYTFVASAEDTVAEGKEKAVIEYADLSKNDPKMPEDFDIDSANVPTYTTDECKIVLETYEDGTKILLNFNNYTVEVKPTAENGLDRTYTIGAYGYAVVAKSN